MGFERMMGRIMAAATALAFSVAGMGVAEASPENPRSVAGGVTALESSQSTDSLAAFWTSERLRQAAENPLPVPAVAAEPKKNSHRKMQRNHGKPQAGVSVEADSVAPGRRSATTASPLATGATVATLSRSDLASPLGWQVNITGRLFFSVGDGYSSCSAAAIVSNNKNSIWTAGHCLHGGKDGSFYSNFVFAPGYDETAPWGFWPLRSIIVSSDWADSGDLTSGDIGGGIVRTPQPEYGDLQDWIGAYGYRFNGDADVDDVTSLGYPADGYNRTGTELHDGTKPMYCQGNAVDAGNWNPFDNRLKLACDMGHGASGGPMVINFGQNSQIVGTNSHRLADENDNWVENYLYSSNHGGNAAGVINWLNSH
ncbi:trypsin-like serine peptidase [Kitasatospora purpeofusca]|uniref:trypsin-like serine peptidase n=1 Tax=Kitasatospora purpeofusca TaxID=67352 RepID=UPI0038235673